MNVATRLGRADYGRPMRTVLGLPAIAAAIIASTCAARADSLPPVVGLLDQQGNSGDGFIEDETEETAEAARRDGRASDPAPLNQLRLDLGIGGPGGLMALRYSRVLSTKTRIEPGLGLGYTGVIGSLMITQPFYERVRRPKGHAPMFSSLGAYLGYSASLRSASLEHPWVGNEAVIPNGAYHWIDFGLSVQTRWHNVLLTVGAGVTKLVAAPDGVGGPMETDDDEDFLWWIAPEGWFANPGIAPSLWSSVGYAF